MLPGMAYVWLKIIRFRFYSVIQRCQLNKVLPCAGYNQYFFHQYFLLLIISWITTDNFWVNFFRDKPVRKLLSGIKLILCSNNSQRLVAEFSESSGSQISAVPDCSRISF